MSKEIDETREFQKRRAELERYGNDLFNRLRADGMCFVFALQRGDAVTTGTYGPTGHIATLTTITVDVVTKQLSTEVKRQKAELKKFGEEDESWVN